MSRADELRDEAQRFMDRVSRICAHLAKKDDREGLAMANALERDFSGLSRHILDPRPRALLTRTEAAPVADGAAFIAVAERLAADGVSPGDLDPNATMTEHRAQCRRCGDFVAIAVPTPTVAPVADVAVAWLCEWTDEDDGETVRVSFEYKRGAESRAAEVGGDARVIPLFTHPHDASAAVILAMLDKRIADERNQMRRWALLCFRDAAMSAKGNP